MKQRAAYGSIGIDAASVLLPKAFAGVANVLLQVYAIRHLEPGIYGGFGIGLTCLVLIESFVGVPLDLGVLREAPLLRGVAKCALSPVERSAIVIKLGVGALLFLFSLGVSWRFDEIFLEHLDGSGTFPLSILAGTGILLVRSVQVSFQVSGRFRLFGAADLAHSLLRLVLVFGVVSAGAASVASLLSAYAVAAFAVVLVFGSPLLRGALGVSWVRLGDCARLLRYAGGVLLVGALSTLLTSVDIFFLGFWSGLAEVGLYRAGLSLALLPEVLGSCLAQVFGPRIVVYCRDGVFHDFFVRYQLIAFLSSLLILAVGLALTVPVVSRVFPESYSASVSIILILLPAGVSGLISFPLAVNFLAFYSLKKLLIIDCILAPFMLAGYYYGAREGAIAVAWVTCVSRVVKTIALHFTALRAARSGQLAIRRQAGSLEPGWPAPLTERTTHI